MHREAIARLKDVKRTRHAWQPLHGSDCVHMFVSKFSRFVMHQLTSPVITKHHWTARCNLCHWNTLCTEQVVSGCPNRDVYTFCWLKYIAAGARSCRCKQGVTYIAYGAIISAQFKTVSCTFPHWNTSQTQHCMIAKQGTTGRFYARDFDKN